MRRFIIALALCFAVLVPWPSHAGAARPPVLSLLGNAVFLSATQGWVEISSSAGYSSFCYRAAPQPASCNKAVTRVYATADGGRTWRRILQFGGHPLSSSYGLPVAWMHVFDSRHGMVLPVGGQGHNVLYRTADGGANWATESLPGHLAYLAPTDITFVGENDLWLLAHRGAAMGSEAVDVYRTRDAGRHWSRVACTSFSNPAADQGCPLHSGISTAGHKDNIVFVNPSTGVLVDNNYSGIPFLYVSHDGGAHWTVDRPGLPRGVPAPNPRTGVSPYGEFQQAIFFGRLGILPATVTVCRAQRPGGANTCSFRYFALLSHNGGRTWPTTRRFPFAAREQAQLVWQVMDQTTWYAVQGGRLWSTIDAGAHWTSVPSPMPRGYVPVSVQFVSRATGFAVAARIKKPDYLAQSTRLLRTDDGGRHWSVLWLPGTVN